MFKRIGLLIGIVFLSALLYSRAHAANAVVVQASEQEWQVTLSTTTVPAGTPVQFQVTNNGKIQHEFVIEKAGAVDQHLTQEVEGQEVDAEIEAFNPGQTKTLTWTFAEPGKYQVACHIPGHFEAGMMAQFTVVAADPSTSAGSDPAANNNASPTTGTGSAPASNNNTSAATNSGTASTTTHTTTSSGTNPTTLPASGGIWQAPNLPLLGLLAGVLVLLGGCVWKFAR